MTLNALPTLADSDDPDEMQHDAAFHQGLGMFVMFSAIDRKRYIHILGQKETPHIKVKNIAH